MKKMSWSDLSFGSSGRNEHLQSFVPCDRCFEQMEFCGGCKHNHRAIQLLQNDLSLWQAASQYHQQAAFAYKLSFYFIMVVAFIAGFTTGLAWSIK